MKDNTWTTGNSNIDGHNENMCLHNQTKMVSVCKAGYTECHGSTCHVLDDEISDCADLVVKEICEACGKEIE